MTELLVKRFVKNYENVSEAKVRTSYGVLTSMVGIFCNVLLFLGKVLAGIVMGSVSVMADAFNNLSDAGSSVIGLVGIKMASKPADEKHPFGHGRIEYIAALVVAFVILQVGFRFLKEGIDKIRNPEDIKFSYVSILILLFSILMKLWLGFFNKKLGQRIDSTVMLATAADSLGDVLVTSTTLVSILVFRFWGFNIDGYVGVIVSLMVMWAGISVAKDTLSPLIGGAVSEEEYEKIAQFVEAYKGIVGSHDLIVHDYGPGRSMASIHAEVPNDVDIEVSHEIIDRIERDAQVNLGIFLVIHMDPVETKDERVLAIKEELNDLINRIDENVSMHDFRMVEGKKQINLIFDLVIPYTYDDNQAAELEEKIKEDLHKLDRRYVCVITMDRSYVNSEVE
ncbi:cation diffusion facilitator family transporter [Aequitasia blattaphilus]|uniref:Cation diffusion facilitator family transporter n=1 Tax=Aequitasia blattaphilus TaxID=2949332 RepID=A0ABT1E7D0_9FIRM|nr:cation diffusion facilitator family transporter [Aequitasia blattaphilus]MCP1100877.1 cation diffusion facilitator family transporter [Aequitasia blattaphilus]MCR8613517.1 cation diffusion facilitator family transporter [Aequitasia blattaphilus]